MKGENILFAFSNLIHSPGVSPPTGDPNHRSHVALLLIYHVYPPNTQNSFFVDTAKGTIISIYTGRHIFPTRLNRRAFGFSRHSRYARLTLSRVSGDSARNSSIKLGSNLDFISRQIRHFCHKHQLIYQLEHQLWLWLLILRTFLRGASSQRPIIDLLDPTHRH